LALVSTGFKPGLVTVALELWQSDCRQTKPTRWGGVRLRVETTRVSVRARSPYLSKRLQLSDRFFTPQIVSRLNTATSDPDLASPVSGGFSFNNVFCLAGKVNLCKVNLCKVNLCKVNLCKVNLRPSSFLVSR
jgi:hypothetical protein